MASPGKQGVPFHLARYHAERKIRKAKLSAAGKKGAQIRLSPGQERGGELAGHDHHPINIDAGAQVEPSSPVEVRISNRTEVEPLPPDSAPKTKRKRSQVEPYDPSKFGAVQVTTRHNGKVRASIRNPRQAH